MLKIDAEMPKSCWVCEIGPADQVPNCPFYKLPGEEQRKEEYKTGRHPDCPIGEFIRCEECKHSFVMGFVCVRYMCEKHPELGNIPEDWFCGDGEREERSGADHEHEEMMEKDQEAEEAYKKLREVADGEKEECNDA